MVRDLNPNGRGLLNIPFLGLAVGKESWVLTTWPIAKAQRAKKIEYWGHYPVADIEYEIDSPVSVGLRAWCPFLPGDVDSSQLPGAVFEVNLRNLAHSDVKGTLTFSFPGPAIASASAWTRQLRSESRFRGVVLEGRNCSYALGLINEDHVRTGGGIGNDEMAWAAVAERLPREDHRDPGSSVAIDFVLARGQRKAVRFVLAWHTPTWESDFPYGLKLSKYTNRYTQRYTSALELAQKLSEEHVSLLRRVLAWQQVIYTEKDLPIWVRDQLINSLHLITEESYWAVGTAPLGQWCYQGGLFSLVESTVAAGQQSCIPCDWYGNFPVVYFFPELVWSTLRAFRVKMRDDGAVPFYLGQGLDLAGGPDETNYAYDRQRSQNGCCYADLVDRLWLVTGNDEVLHEFYPSVKKNLIHTIRSSEGSGAEGVFGIISETGDEWYESMDMRVARDWHKSGLLSAWPKR